MTPATPVYESTKILAEYLLFHFGSDAEILPPGHGWPEGMRAALGFPQRTVGYFSSAPAARGLDLGCAVGRSAFEMAAACREVVGIDFSHAFITAAAALQRGEGLRYHRTEEAGLTTPLTARAPTGADLSRVTFLQGDAMDLPAELGSFDRVHAANLICRLPEPQRLLRALPALVRPGGELVLATPCTWLEEFTPRENWPEAGTFDLLKSALEPHFRLVTHADEPFLIRETARKFQWTQSLVSVWQRLSEPATNALPV
jgi:putative 4-mercaptohistidine N1-methyltranferase